MKYLKTYESLSKSFFEIGEFEYPFSDMKDEDENLTDITFDKKEIQEIKKWSDLNKCEVNLGYKEERLKEGYTQICVSKEEIVYFKLHHSISKSIFDCYILRERDEWFFINILDFRDVPNIKYYKCDQLTGLIDCLNYIIKDNI